jgi:hypothetical protein
MIGLTSAYLSVDVRVPERRPDTLKTTIWNLWRSTFHKKAQLQRRSQRLRLMRLWTLMGH